MILGSRIAAAILLCSELSIPVMAQDVRNKPHFIGVWQLTEDRCEFLAKTLTITAADTTHLIANEKNYPALTLNLPHGENEYEIYTPAINFLLVGPVNLTTQNKGPDGIMATCHYVNHAKVQAVFAPK